MAADLLEDAMSEGSYINNLAGSKDRARHAGSEDSYIQMVAFNKTGPPAAVDSQYRWHWKRTCSLRFHRSVSLFINAIEPPAIIGSYSVSLFGGPSSAPDQHIVPSVFQK
jgi:hypothetical protein